MQIVRNESQRFHRGALYPVIASNGMPTGRLCRSTGEYRPPRRGELFLSGSVIEGYKALCDFREAYWIAEAV